MSLMTSKVGKNKVHLFIENNILNVKTLVVGCGKKTYDFELDLCVRGDVIRSQITDLIFDAHNIPFSDKSFDQIICSEVIEHLHSPEVAARELTRVLSDNGVMIATIPFCYPVHEAPDDYTRWTEYGIRKLFSEMREVEVFPLFTAGQTIAVLIQRIAFQTDLGRFKRAMLHRMAHVLYKFSSWSAARWERNEFQDISRTRRGPFLTAGYGIVARK